METDVTRSESLSVRELVERHDKDLYRGNGLPGLATRMALVEEQVESNADQINVLDKRMWAILVGVAGIFITVVIDIAVRLKS